MHVVTLFVHITYNEPGKPPGHQPLMRTSNLARIPQIGENLYLYGQEYSAGETVKKVGLTEAGLTIIELDGGVVCTDEDEYKDAVASYVDRGFHLGFPLESSRR